VAGSRDMGARAHRKRSGMHTGSRICKIVQKMVLEARWDVGECEYVSSRQSGGGFA